ncbi:MAG: hypothetical protein ABIT01_12975, partial [Thermoanaerobaculia bacterium]
MSREMEAGNCNREAGNRNREAGNRNREAGNRNGEAGNRQEEGPSFEVFGNLERFDNRQAHPDRAFTALRALDPGTLRRLIVPGAGGRRVFRILLKNSCRYACGDCPMKDQGSLASPLLEPARIARLFLIAYRRGWCDGIFITSGVARSSAWATEKTLELVETLRVTHGFRGYIHVKAPEGIEPGQLERLLRLVDRVSHHREARCMEAVQSETSSVPAAESHETAGLAPVPARATEGAAAPAWGMRPRRGTRAVSARSGEHSFGAKAFAKHESGFRRVATSQESAFPSDDPKLEWAVSHPDEFPVEVTTATREELLRVPGLGPRSVDWILVARAHGRLSFAGDLEVLGPAASRAAGFLIFRGRLVRMKAAQPTLFEPLALQG